MRPGVNATATLVLAAGLLSGCAARAARPVTPGVTVPAQWQRTEPSSAAVGELPEDLARFWQQFGDATLSDLVARALAGSPDLRSARARVREARARRGLAAKDYLPSVDGTLSASVSGTGASGGGSTQDLYRAGFDASWEPDVFGATHRAVSAAQADLEASQEDLHATQVSLVAELALNYVELRALQARLTIARDNLARQEETLKLTTWRAQAGLTTELDVEQARANAEQTRAQVPNLETGVAEAEHRLAMLIGQPPAALHERLAVPGSIPTASARVAVGIPADTLRQRPDVRATERRLAAATARLGQAEAARYPSLRLSGSLDVEAASVGGLANGGTLVRSLLGSLTAPLFDRGRIRRQIEIQGAVQEQAVVAWEQAMLTALEDVENALVALDGAQRRQAALADGATAARNAARLARDQYTAGLASYLTVLVSERSALSLEDELKSSEAASSSALIRLYKALGGGWSTE
jgi:NodT family efflux transporter outer membrane factor (OMF) lipoprotein